MFHLTVPLTTGSSQSPQLQGMIWVELLPQWLPSWYLPGCVGGSPSPSWARGRQWFGCLVWSTTAQLICEVVTTITFIRSFHETTRDAFRDPEDERFRTKSSFKEKNDTQAQSRPEILFGSIHVYLKQPSLINCSSEAPI